MKPGTPNRRFARLLELVILAVTASSCSSPSDDSNSSDAGASGGSSGSTSGSGNDSGGSSGSSSGGVAGSGGDSADAGQGGSSGIGGDSSSAGSGGDSAGGSGGNGGAETSSPGCGKANPEAGTLDIPVNGNTGSFIVSLPSDYDENHPYPLGFAFHGRDRTGPNCQQGDCIGFQSVMSEHAILVYMTALGGTGWEGDGERELNVTFFSDALTKIKSDYCVDLQRIFVAGTSSGANFTNILACRFGDQLLAAAPVAGEMLEQQNCATPTAALLIHGVDDYHVPFAGGQAARDFYAARNGCSGTTTPAIADIHASVVANRESHQCVSYQGCGAGLPVTWCEHSEGGYDGSTHGWPTFGGQQIWDFVSALP